MILQQTINIYPFLQVPKIPSRPRRKTSGKLKFNFCIEASIVKSILFTSEKNSTQEYLTKKCVFFAVIKQRNRTIFTNKQLLALEAEFSAGRFISRTRRIVLSEELVLPENQIKVWFQNRRAKFNKNRKNIDMTQKSTSSRSESFSSEPMDFVKSNNNWAQENNWAQQRPIVPCFTNVSHHGNGNHYDANKSADKNLQQNHGSIKGNNNNLIDIDNIIETYMTNGHGNKFDNNVGIHFDKNLGSNFNNIGSSSYDSCNNLDYYNQPVPPTMNSEYKNSYEPNQNFGTPCCQYVGVGSMMPYTENQQFDTFYNFENDFFQL